MKKYFSAPIFLPFWLSAFPFKQPWQVHHPVSDPQQFNLFRFDPIENQVAWKLAQMKCSHVRVRQVRARAANLRMLAYQQQCFCQRSFPPPRHFLSRLLKQIVRAFLNIRQKYRPPDEVHEKARQKYTRRKMKKDFRQQSNKARKFFFVTSLLRCFPRPLSAFSSLVRSPSQTPHPVLPAPAALPHRWTMPHAPTVRAGPKLLRLQHQSFG